MERHCCFGNVLKDRAITLFARTFAIERLFQSAEGGNRTHTPLTGLRILSLESGDSDERPSVETADHGHVETHENAPWPTQNEGVGQASDAPAVAPVLAVDPVELALATALERASVAGQWTSVELLARELEARRRARGAVVDLDAERSRRR
jgi:hypothetical protein